MNSGLGAAEIFYVTSAEDFKEGSRDRATEP